MAEVRDRPGGGVRLAIWLTLCVAAAAHGLIQWAFAPTIQTFCLTQLGVSLVLGLTAATVLRTDAGWTLAGLFLNLMLSVAGFLAGAAIMIAGFH
jgi:hypothetical protein